MNEYIPIDRKLLKRDAKAAMRAHRPSVYGVAIVFLLITMLLSWLSRKLEFPGVSTRMLTEAMGDPEAVRRIYVTVAENRSTFGTILSVVISIMDIMIGGGFTFFCLGVARRIEAGYGSLFEMFAWFIRYLWLNILMGIFIFLWSLLLVIPGIIAAYRYSMAQYIFFDDPEKGALQCIRESKAMTRGYKGKLFVLDLSFIGWAILSIIPFVSIYTTPYMSVTKANYYRVLRGEFYAQQQQQQNPYGGYNGGGYNGGGWGQQ
jgi:uncharacterized membrane protein